MKLGVIADTRHHRDGDGRLATIEPVAAQLEQLAAMFDEVVLLVPLWPGPPPPGFRPYRCDNVSISPIHAAGGTSAAAKARLALRIPGWSLGIVQLLRRVDAVHLRAPCNVALLGILATRFSRRHRTAMFAGNWHGYDREPASYRAQRRLLGRHSFGGPVTVYTDQQPVEPHVVPFFSPSFTLEAWNAESDVVQAKIAALAGRVGPVTPVRLVTVGHLEANKDQATILDAVRLLRDHGIDARLDIVGDGPLLQPLHDRRSALDLAESVRFRGRVPLHTVRACYRDADINVLASRTEGYPKAVAEGMVGGAVPVTSRFPMSGSLLGGGDRGATFPTGDAGALTATITGLVREPERMARMIAAGRAYSRTVTLDAFGERLHDILESQWRVRLPVPRPTTSARPS